MDFGVLCRAREEKSIRTYTDTSVHLTLLRMSTLPLGPLHQTLLRKTERDKGEATVVVISERTRTERGREVQGVRMAESGGVEADHHRGRREGRRWWTCRSRWGGITEGRFGSDFDERYPYSRARQERFPFDFRRCRKRRIRHPGTHARPKRSINARG